MHVVAFTDDRNVDAHWLGTVRGGFGQPLKSLETAQPMSEVIAQAFADGLAARGLRNDGDKARFSLSGSVVKFDCSQFINREAHAIIKLTLTETAGGRVLMSQSFRRDLVRDNPNLFDTGIFASTDALRAVALEALRAIVDQALDSAEIKRAISA